MCSLELGKGKFLNHLKRKDRLNYGKKLSNYFFTQKTSPIYMKNLPLIQSLSEFVSRSFHPNNVISILLLFYLSKYIMT